MEKHRPSIQPKTVNLPKFDKAIDSLQELGFETELWLTEHDQQITLRWCKKGAKWHITARGFNHMNAHLETMGRQALKWLHAREFGNGNEANYAVHET